MADDAFEIEYLEEDADVVQQCVQPVAVPIDDPKIIPLLIERSKPQKRKPKKDEEDSDYDPRDEIAARFIKSKRRKTEYVTKPVPKTSSTSKPQSQKFTREVQKIREEPKEIVQQEEAIKEVDRKKINVKIPDYEDPLCLPVKAIKQDTSDAKKLKSWNELCLNHFETADTVFRTDFGEATSSKRILVLKNVMNKSSAKVETTMWTKTLAEDKFGNKKTYVIQSILPRFKEKTFVRPYNLIQRKPRSSHTVEVAIVSKEINKDGESLVVYKPQTSEAAVYKFSGEKTSINEKDTSELSLTKKKSLVETAYCKMCAPCFQTSWRGFNKKDDTSIHCVICSRTFGSVYGLLSHLKTHAPENVKQNKRLISKTLARVVEYHYKCRICKMRFDSIKELRGHVETHRGTEQFLCEVGNHMTN